LSRPSEDENIIHNLATVKDHQLRPEFNSGITELKNIIESQAEIKTINSKIINGRDFI